MSESTHHHAPAEGDLTKAEKSDTSPTASVPQLTTGDADDRSPSSADKTTTPQVDIDTAALEKKLVRKLDIRILPIIVLLYVLNYLDRNSITAARDNGLVDDLQLTPRQYETCLSILYVGYILLQIPSNLLLSYCGRPRIYLPVCVGTWGVVSALSAVTHDFRGLVGVRFALGIVEAAYFPGALLLLSKYYTRKELSSRMALLYGGSILSNAVSGLISAGIIGGLEGARGIRAWRWLFIIEGAITVFFAIVAVFVLPDFPHNSTMLTEAERRLAMQRMADDSGQSDVEGANGDRPIDGLKQAVSDPIVLLFTLCLTSCVTGVGFNQFFPTIVGTLGYDHVTTLIITFGPWGWAFLCVLANALHANKTGERTLHLCIPLCIGIIGFIIASATQNLGARFFALFLEAQSYAGYVIILSWMSNSIRGAYKRSVGLALINCVSQLGNISASYMWKKEWGPSYWRSNVISLCCFLVTIGTATTIRLVLQRRNRELDRMHGTLDHTVDAEGHAPSAKTGEHLPDVVQVVAGDDAAAVQRTLAARAQYRFLV